MKPLMYREDDKENKEEESLTGGLINFKFFETAEPLTVTSPANTSSSDKKTTTTKKKRSSKKDTDLVVAEDSDSKLTYAQSNKPYLDSYKETNNMLKASVYQIDQLQSDIDQQIKAIKNSSLRKKYDYLAEFGSTMASLVGTKITAIREMNNSITHGHDLDLKRMKSLSLENNKDDDKYIMDMYNSFINTPVGTYNPLDYPSLPNLTTKNNISSIDIVTENGDKDIGYQNYMNNLTPSQHMMLLEGDPNIETVLVYDQNTGARWFDVRNMVTGESIPNVSLPDQSFAEDCVIDLRHGRARNTNLNLDYKLIIQGADVLKEY